MSFLEKWSSWPHFYFFLISTLSLQSRNITDHLSHYQFPKKGSVFILEYVLCSRNITWSAAGLLLILLTTSEGLMFLSFLKSLVERGATKLKIRPWLLYITCFTPYPQLSKYSMLCNFHHWQKEVKWDKGGGFRGSTAYNFGPLEEWESKSWTSLETRIRSTSTPSKDLYNLSKRLLISYSSWTWRGKCTSKLHQPNVSYKADSSLKT